MASLLKQDGRYYLQFYNTHRSPKRKKVPLGTSRKRPAKRKQRELEDAYLHGEFDPWRDDPHHYKDEGIEDVSVREARERFLVRKREDGLRKSTLRTYRAITRLFEEDVCAGSSLNHVSASEVRTFVRNPSVSKATRRKRYGHLRAFLRWCKGEKLLRENPIEEVAAPEKPQKLPKAITEEQLEQICEEVRRDYAAKREKGNVREGQVIWRIPLFWFAFCTGMRGSELARLRWKHIDPEKRLIYVLEQKNKKEQTIPLNRKAKEVLADVPPGSENDFVFRAPYFDAKQRSIRSFRERASETFRKARDRIGMEKTMTFHSLRHGFCTKLAEAGKPLQVIKEAARHADVETSMIYVHMANEHLKSELDDVF